MDNPVDTAISVMKVISMIAAAVFGAVGVLTEYRDKQGNVTRWGKVALAGVIISGFLSITLHWFETDRAKAEAVDARRRADEATAALAKILNASDAISRRQAATLADTATISRSTAGISRDTATALESLKKVTDQGRDIANSMTVALNRAEEGLVETRRVAAGMRDSLDAQSRVLREQTRVQRQVVRAYYPLQPLTIHYEIQYAMDEPRFAPYIARVEGEITKKYGRPAREIGDGDVEFILTARGETWAPLAAGDEERVHAALLSDERLFRFTEKDVTGGTAAVLTFVSAPKYLQGVILNLPPKGDIAQTVELRGDFRGRTLTKRVTCKKSNADRF